MDDQLSTSDINKYLCNVKHFKGVFPINKVTTIQPKKEEYVTFIANLQPDNLPGNHWVAVRRTNEYCGFYFDSYGRLPPPEIQMWLTKNSSKWTYNFLRIQNTKDVSACGYLCIAFVKNLL